jgi:hypothetical protein
MKKLIILPVILLMMITAWAQIPNYGFENWTTHTFLSPSGWTAVGTVSQVTPGYSGNYAIKLERDSTNQNMPGAIIYGTPDDEGFSGGIPFADRPDSLVGLFNYNIEPGDSAWVMIYFKLNGTPVSNDLYYITGDHSSGFIRLAFMVNYLSELTPDSLILGITSTNPNNDTGFGYLIVDELYFTNTSLPIPNGDFEVWNTQTSEEPDSWFTPNFMLPYGSNMPVTKTTEHNFGDFAIRIENIPTPDGWIYGWAFTGPQGENGPLPGFPVTIKDSTLNGYYKFFPQNGDPMVIGIKMFEAGAEVGGGYFVNYSTVAEYTPFTTMINYNDGYTGTPDSATILLLSFAGGQSPLGNSVLYVDDLSLDALLTSDRELRSKNPIISFYPNPANDFVILEITDDKSYPVEIQIYSLLGKRLKSETAVQNQHEMNISDLKTGVYLVSINTKNRSENQKLIIRR